MFDILLLAHSTLVTADTFLLYLKKSCSEVKILIPFPFISWHNSPPPSVAGLPKYRGFTITFRNTTRGKTLLDELLYPEEDVS